MPKDTAALEDDLVDRLRLIRSYRVGPATYRRLIAETGSAAAALAHLPRVARKAGVKDYRSVTADQALAEIDAGQRAGARLIAEGEAAFPPTLGTTDDSPPLLWVRGDAALGGMPAVGIVGARNASSLGLRTARMLGTELGAEGLCVVSGLARGIDTAAHLAALPTGTIAVLPGGIDTIYPPENLRLAAEIAERGLLVAEQPFGTAPLARHFPRRNRIIAGLVQGVVVVEAASRSGALITTSAACDLGREVMAVPGHPLDARAAGCNMLIRDGAVLVRSAGDILEALASAAPRERAKAALPDEPAAAPGPPREVRERVLALLGAVPVTEDQLIRASGLAPRIVASEITAMELDGQVTRHRGGMVALTA